MTGVISALPVNHRVGGSLKNLILIIIINYLYNAHNTLQGMSLCAVRKKRLGGGGGTVQVHDIIAIIQIM